MINRLLTMDFKKVLAAILLICLTGLLIMLGSGSNLASGFSGGNPEKKAAAMVNEMTLEEKVYQMFIVSIDKLVCDDGNEYTTEITGQTLESKPVGGIICTQENAVNDDEIKTLINRAQRYSDIGLFIVADEDGTNAGLNSMYTYRDDGRITAYDNARKTASVLKEAGFNLDLAPVGDVWSNANNTVVGEKAYSDDFDQAAKLVSAAVKGFGSKDVLCTLRTFPGEGDLAVEDGTSRTYICQDKKSLQSNEYTPFKEGIKSGADAVMVGSAIVTDIDDSAPACFSEDVVTGQLREKLGFDGLVITDYLSDGVIAESYTSGNAAALAVAAGCDILLDPDDLTEAAGTILYEVNSGNIAESQINESVTRILEAKIKAGIIK